MPVAAVQASIATFTHVGIGIVRTRPCLPTRSTMHQRSSRCWTCSSVSAATSDRRKPAAQQDGEDRAVAESLLGGTSGVFRSVGPAPGIASSRPGRLSTTPLTRVMPAASSGASKPLSAASTAF